LCDIARSSERMLNNGM